MRHIVLCLALALVSIMPAPASVSITGRVLKHQTHRAIPDRADAPVPHATVIATRMVRVGRLLRRADHLVPATATADTAGRFSIPNLSAGTYDVRALVPAGVACRRLFVLSPLGPDCILNARENPAWTPLAPQDIVQD